MFSQLAKNIRIPELSTARIMRKSEGLGYPYAMPGILMAYILHFDLVPLSTHGLLAVC